MARILNHHGSAAILYVFIATLALLALACGAKTDPYAVGDRATPTPASTVMPGSIAGPVSTPGAEPWFDHEGKGIIRFAEWSDKPVRLANSMTGYIIVHGFDYNVELITVEQVAAQQSLLEGHVDILALLDRAAQKEWYDAQLAARTVIDLGSLYQSRPDIRIVGSASLKQRAPELVTFFGQVKPGDDAFDAQAAQITTGRVGINPIVASLTFFRNNDALWQTWAPADVVGRVQKAITSGKNSLRNRACAPHDPFGTSVDCQE